MTTTARANVRPVRRHPSTAFASLFPLVLCGLFGGGCPLPEPRDAVLVFALAPDAVTLDARLNDLLADASDELDTFNALSWVLTPDTLAAAVQTSQQRLWLARPTSYALKRRAEALDVAFTAPIARADFDACLRVGCDGTSADPTVKDMCASFPLRRCGNGKYQARLEDGYAVTPGQRSSWPATAKRIELRVARTPLRNERSLGAAYHRLGQDLAAAGRARALMREATLAFKANDRAQLDANVAKAAALPPALAEVPAMDLRRVRLLYLYEVLAKHDPAQLERPASPTFVDELRQLAVPTEPLPADMVWGLRALYEVATRAPAAFQPRRDALCQSKVFGSKPAREICAALGFTPRA